MAENTKTPPAQDPRQRTPQGDPNKPQKPGSPGPSVGTPDRDRTGGSTPGKPGQDMDPDRNRVQKPMPGSGKKDGDIGAEITEIDDDDEMSPTSPGRDKAP